MFNFGREFKTSLIKGLPSSAEQWPVAHHNAAGSRVRSYIMENIVGNHFHIFCLLKDDIVCFNVFISEKCFPLQRSKKLDADESASVKRLDRRTDFFNSVKMQRTFKCNFVIGK